MYEDAIILGIIFGFSTFICVIGYKLIKLKLTQEKGIDEDAYNRLAKAFIQHKKDMQQRVETLEAIIAGGEVQVDKEQPLQIKRNAADSRLTNDLQQKDRVGS